MHGTRTQRVPGPRVLGSYSVRIPYPGGLSEHIDLAAVESLRRGWDLRTLAKMAREREKALAREAKKLGRRHGEQLDKNFRPQSGGGASSRPSSASCAAPCA